MNLFKFCHKITDASNVKIISGAEFDLVKPERYPNMMQYNNRESVDLNPAYQF